MTVAAGPLPALLLRHAHDHGARVAIAFEREVLTYAELADQVARVAGALHAAGLRAGERVVLFAPMSRELYVFLLALFWLGAVGVLVDPGMGADRVEAALRLARPRAFVGVPRAFLLRLRSRTLRGVPRLFSVGGSVPGARRVARLATGGRPHPVADDLPSDHPALLTFTTGTTGTPRGAVRSHAFLLAQHEALRAALCSRPDDVDLHALPVFLLHTLAMGGTAVVPRLAAGGTTPHDPAAVCRAVRRFGVTTISASPTFYAPLQAHGLALPGVRAAFVGGAAVPPALVAGLRALLPDGEVHVVYGSTEAEPISTLPGAVVAAETATGALLGRGHCVGAPTPGVRVRLDPLDGDIGEILVSGAHVNPGYYRNPAADRRHKRRDPDGTVWHRTGDCAHEDAHGRLWLMGRRGDQLPRGGRSLWPYAVEGIVEGVPGVRRSALVSVDGRAVVAVEPAARWLSSARLSAAVAHRLAVLGHAVDAVRIVRPIPVDARHRAKIDRRRLLARLR